MKNKRRVITVRVYKNFLENFGFLMLNSNIPIAYKKYSRKWE